MKLLAMAREIRIALVGCACVGWLGYAVHHLLQYLLQR